MVTAQEIAADQTITDGPVTYCPAMMEATKTP